MKSGDNDDVDGGGEPMPLREEDVDIRDIIKVRKADRKLKAEQRRQLDIQRITDLKSVEGIDPLQRCPKEIWGLILDELHPEDKCNAWQVHPLFQDLMKSRRIQDILIPLLLLKVDALDYCVRDTKDDLQFERLRRISKNIMKSYDRLKEEKLNKSIEEAEASSEVHVPGLVNLHLSESNERRLLGRLLTIYRIDSDNPAKRFFPRALSISFCDEYMEVGDGENIHDLFNEHKNNLISLLGIIGDQIWNFRFSFFETGSVPFSSCQVYVLFQQFICLMPNLKWLQVEIDCALQQVSTEEGNGVDANAVLRQYPFPTLADLERLSFHSPFEYELGRGSKSFHIHEVVLQANQHVKIVDFDEFDDNSFARFPHHLIKSLPLISFRACNDQIRGMRLENIQHIVNFNWKLKKINLSLDYRESGTLASISTLLHFLERFPTLETVKLKELNGFKFHQNDTFRYLNLPNLKVLELVLTDPKINLEGNIHFFFSLQFLLHCEKLKTLKWKMQGIPENDLRIHLKKNENEKMLDFRAGLRNLYDSNLFDVFLFLETVKVKIKKRSRPSAHALACKHEYSRKRLTDYRNLSLEKFMESHGCSIDNSLQCCVLQE